MLYPTIDQLTNDEFNRYELALATAKCARILTDEYVTQKDAAEKAATGNKEADRNVINQLNKEYREEKAVKNAITKIHNGTFKIVRSEAVEAEVETEAEAVTENTEN
ncbi:MAG: DNA-directed RNA polymerase subunit omega [Ruminococcaceae bacterium]|nr:DNA-directed RNA polymerase subunit omega [Oscillospiraceae bacterium]